MRILCVGGGSGGHITPIVAVAKNLRERVPGVEIRAWCDRRTAPQMRQLFDDETQVDVIISGKFRRYANLSLWKKLRYHIFRTYFRNFLDFFKIGFGFLQSLVKLIVWRPNVVFCKGGFVCLPVGVAARVLRIPLAIHDSDTTPGLTNRVLARFANAIGTGSPIENYPNYPKDKTKFVGIPLRTDIKKLIAKERSWARKSLGLEPDKKLVFAVGGGMGASHLNRAVVEAAPKILANGAQILLVTGKGKTDLAVSDLGCDFQMREFLADDMPLAIGAADVVITRAGATAMAEFAAVGAATIIVPSPHLAGDHQTKNAVVYAKANAAVVIDERDLDKRPELLTEAVTKLLDSEKLRKDLGKSLSDFARPDALKQMVDMILGVAK